AFIITDTIHDIIYMSSFGNYRLLVVILDINESSNEICTLMFFDAARSGKMVLSIVPKYEQAFPI
ncbi:unnamed protein product, partial [Rotaria magnacalcarata]